MRRVPTSADTIVAGVAGFPVKHSLSPLIHNTWLREASLDGVYIGLAPSPDRFQAFLDGLRGGVIRGLNVTAPYKEAALLASDEASARAIYAGAANLLLFDQGGGIIADNTDGEGLLDAFHRQAPGFDVTRGPAIILGAGGAARGAAAAFLGAGAPEVLFLNRSMHRARQLAELFGSRATAIEEVDGARLLEASAMINATPMGLHGDFPPPLALLEGLGGAAVVMDMVYRPLDTRFLSAARALGLRTVDGLQMLIGQAIPSFEAFFGRPPPAIDIRSLVLVALETQR
jgi:shikimate dehydrogenase